jgi:hypothetical protein
VQHEKQIVPGGKVCSDNGRGQQICYAPHVMFLGDMDLETFTKELKLVCLKAGIVYFKKKNPKNNNNNNNKKKPQPTCK